MKLNVDPDSPVPLYHQIAEAISYRIATGRLASGEKLLPVREAAVSWGVNMHTVRRAYAELAERSLVESRGALGTRVIKATRAGSSRGREVDAFLKRVLTEAAERHGLTAGSLARLLTNSASSVSAAGQVVHVVECSETQCADHVGQIEATWRVDARPWCLSRKGEPPNGPVVATYFHYNEIRARWPHRLQDIHFAAIHPDPELVSSIKSRAQPGKRQTLRLCEFDRVLALNMASDLSVLFRGDRYRIEPCVVKTANELLDAKKDRKPVLLAPRVWAQLTPREQDDPRVTKVDYVFSEEELARVGDHFGWRRR